MQRTALVTAAVSCLAIAGLSFPGYAASVSSDFGALDPLGHSQRTIPITESTRYVNVTKFEMIKFVVRDANAPEWSFVWRFETFGTPTFPLSEIAPRPLTGKNPIQVYVADFPKDMD